MYWKRSLASVIAATMVLSLTSWSQAIAGSSTLLEVKGAPKPSAKTTRKSAARHVLKQSRKPHSLKASGTRGPQVNCECEELIDEGVICFIMEDYEGAVEVLTEALDLNPDAVDAYGYRGYSYYYLGKFDEASADADKAISLDPKWHMPFEVRGLCLFVKGDTDKAIESLGTAISLDSTCTEALLNRGWIYLATSKLEPAEADFTAVIKLVPNHYLAYFWRAVTYVSLKNYDAAKSDADKTIAISDDGSSHELLGYVLESKGDKENAVAEYKKAAERYTAAGETERAKTAQEKADSLATA